MSGYKLKPPDQEEYKHSEDIFKKIDSKALVCVWKEIEDSFFSKCECCYTAVVAISTLDNMRSYLKRIPGGCPGTKNSKLAVQVKDEPSFEEEMVRVWEEFEDCSRGGDNTDALISNFKSCYTAVVATSQFSFKEEIVRVWEGFEDCSRGYASNHISIPNFEGCYTAVVATSQSSNIPAEIRAFRVLKRSGVSEEQRMLVLAMLNT